MIPRLEQTVGLAPGLRLQWEPAQGGYVLLYPEGMVNLNDSAREVLRRCDGRRFGALLEDLRQAFPGAELDADVREFMAAAQAEGWIRVG